MVKAASGGRGREHAAGLIDSLLLIVTRIGANLLTLCWTLLLVRLLQPEASGIALQAISVAQILSILVTLNVESGSVRVIVPAREHGRMQDAAGFIRFNRRMMLVTVPVLAALAALALLSGLHPPEGTATLMAMAVAVLLVALARLSARHATALGVMRKGLLPRLLTGPLVLSAGLGLAAWAKLPLQPWHVVLLFALSEGLTVIIQNSLLRKDFAFMQGVAAPMAQWRDWTRMGLWLTPGLVMTEYRKAVLIAVAALTLTGTETSLFAVAFSIVNFINFGVTAVDIAFSPRIAQAMAAGQALRRDRLLAVSSAIKLVGWLLGVALVLGFGNMALNWFGPDFHQARPALLIMLLVPAMLILFGPASVLLSSRGKGRADFTGNLIGAVACAVAVAGLGALYGVTGAAIGAVLAQFVQQFVMMLQCRSKLGIDPSLAGLRHLLRRASPSNATVTP